MNLGWFRDLEHVAQTGSFSQAAQRSNLSQPALSRRIKALEAWVGVVLIDRSRHPVTLTGAGVQILEAGQQAQARLDYECKHVREAQALPDRGTVTFAAQHSIGWRFYPSWLQAFESAYGPISSRLRADDLPNCLQDLSTGVVDFVVAYESRQKLFVAGSREMESLRIGQDMLIPVSKMGSDGRPMFDPARAGTIIPYLQFGPTASISQHIEPLLNANNLHARLQVVYENSMAGALLSRVREGNGVAWLPKSLVASDLEAGNLTRIGSPNWHAALDIKLHRIRRHGNSLTNKIWGFLLRREDVPLLGEN